MGCTTGVRLFMTHSPPPRHHTRKSRRTTGFYSRYKYRFSILILGRNSTRCRPIPNICLYFVGTYVLYLFRLQPIVSQSSTEADFITEAETWKCALYLISMLQDLDIPQDIATLNYGDNAAFIVISNSSWPTHRTWYVGIGQVPLLIQNSIVDYFNT